MFHLCSLFVFPRGNEFHQDAGRGLRVQEPDFPGDAFPAFFIDEPETALLHGFEFGINVIDLEGDMVEAFTPLFQEGGHGAVRSHGFDEVDLDAFIDLEEGLGDLLAGGAGDFGLDAEEFFKDMEWIFT
jgi:hypothetical protein